MIRHPMQWTVLAAVVGAGLLAAPALGGESETTVVRSGSTTIIIRQAEPEVYVPSEPTVVVTRPAPRVVYRPAPVIVRPAPVVVRRRPVYVGHPWRWHRRHPRYLRRSYLRRYRHPHVGLSVGFSWCD